MLKNWEIRNVAKKIIPLNILLQKLNKSDCICINKFINCSIQSQGRLQIISCTIHITFNDCISCLCLWSLLSILFLKKKWNFWTKRYGWTSKTINYFLRSLLNATFSHYLTPYDTAFWHKIRYKSAMSHCPRQKAVSYGVS